MAVALAAWLVPGVAAAGTGPVLMPVIDVLVAYTAAAMPYLAPYRPVEQIVDDANRVFLNSDARVRIRLVHTTKVAYVEPSVYMAYVHQLTLDRLVDPDDGYLDELHELRSQYGADVVVLVVEPPDQSSEGFLAPLQADADHAFGLLFPTGSYDLARLIGRMIGCEAQLEQTSPAWRLVGEGAFPDSHAHVFTNWTYYTSATVMAERQNLIPFFSNPELVCFEARLGVSGVADNVRTINLLAPTVAAFKGSNNAVSVPGVEWLSALDGARLLPGSDLDVQVRVHPAAGAVQSVELFRATSYTDLHTRTAYTNLIPGASDRFGRMLTNAAPGWYRFSARAADDQGAVSQETIEFNVRAPNDDFTNRMQLAPDSSVSVDVRGMTLEPGEAAMVPSGVQATAWYTWTAPGEGYLQARIKSQNSSYWWPFVRAYFGTDLGQLTPSGVNPDRNSPLLLRVHAGDTVQLSVGSSRTEATPAELAVAFLPLPVNDSFETRVPVTGSAVMITGHNAGARSSTNAVWPNGMGPTAWWSWTPAVTGFAQIQASNFIPQQAIQVFTGTQPTTLSNLTQFRPSGEGSVNLGSCFPVTAGEPLPVAVFSSPNNPTGAFSFRLSVLEGSPNNTFSSRLTRTGGEWAEPLLFPVASASGAPAGVGPYATWWEWSAPQDGTVVVSISGWGAASVLVFTGDSSNSLQPVPTLLAGAGFAAFTVTAGTTYHLALSWNGIPYYLGVDFAPVLHLGYASANDNFSNRIPLNGTSADWGLTNACGTRESGEPNSPLASWWYSWTALARGRVTLSTTGQVGVAVFQGHTVTQLTNAIANQYWSPLPTFVAEAGVEYKIQVRASSLDYLPATAQMHLEFQPPPANDAFAARPLLAGSDFTIPADLGLATADATDPIIPNTSYRRTLWWRWLIPSDGLASFSTSSASLGVYRLAQDGTLVPVLYSTSGPMLLDVKAGEVLELMLAGDHGPYLGSLRLELRPSDSGSFANDSFAGRTTLAPSNGNPLTLGMSGGSTQAATREPGEPLPGTNTAGRTRWTTWKTIIPAVARVSLSYSGGGLYAEQFRGSQLSSLSSVAWKVSPSLLFRFHAVPGVEYPLVVDAVGTNNTSYSVSVTLTPDACAPTNDLFQMAQIIQGPAGKVSGTHRTATAEPGEPAHGGVPAARSLWYRWFAPRTGSVRLSAKPVSLDNTTPYSLAPYPPGTLAEPHRPGVGVYVGSAVSSLTAQTCRTIPGTNVHETILEFDAVEGQSYAIALEGGAVTDADVGEFEFQLVQLATNDDFTNRIVLSGATALLSGTVFGATRATNEWVAQWPSSSAQPSLMNVWWEWVAPANLRVTLRNVRSNEHYWAVWRSTDQRKYPPIVSVMDRYFGWEDTRRDFVAAAGQVFHIAVYAYSNNVTPVEIELEGVPVPANDHFVNRIRLTGERVSVAARGDNTSREPNEPPHGVGLVGIGYGNVTNTPSLWWSWTAPQSGLFALTTGPQEALLSQSSGPWDQVVRTECFVYEGDQITNLSLVAATYPNTSSSPTGYERVTFAAVGGTTYPIALCPIIREARVWDTAKYFVNLTLQPVTLNASPDAALELTGSSASFSGNLSGEVDSLWWRWTAPESGDVFFTQRMGGADLTRELLIQRYTRNPTNGTMTLQDNSVVQAGETYWLKISAKLFNWWETPPTWDGRDLPFEAALGLRRGMMTNDDFAQAEWLAGPIGVLVGDISGATREPGEPMHAGTPGRGSLWWRWTAPRFGTWTLDVSSSWFGPVLIDLYRGETLSTLERVPLDRNAATGDVLFRAEAGVTYSIAVDHASYIYGTFQFNLIEQLAPGNDSFAGRAPLAGNAPVWTVRNIGASAELGEPFHAGCAPGASLWWSWTAQNSGPVLVGVASGGGQTAWLPPRVAVYRGNTLSSLVGAGANRVGGELVSNLVFQAEANVNYSIVLDTMPQETGDFRLALTPTNAPLNDHFSRRFTVTGSQAQAMALNLGATLEPGEPNPGEPKAGATLWWTWTAPASGPVTIDTAGSSCDTRLAVYQGSTLGTLSLLTINDDAVTAPGSAINLTSAVTFDASQGTRYQIQVGSLAGSLGGLALNVSGQIAPPLPPAELLSAEVLKGTKTCRLQLQGTPGQSIVVQTSSDLLNWEPAGVVRFVTSGATWSEPVDSNAGSRFFRLASAAPEEPSAHLAAAEIVEEESAICRLHLRGTPGQNAVVQGSTNLVDWESLDAIRFSFTNEAWSEPMLPGSTLRFFRLISEP